MTDFDKLEQIEKRRLELIILAITVIVILTVAICFALAAFDYITGWVEFVYSNIIARVIFGLLIIGVVLDLSFKARSQSDLSKELHRKLIQTMGILERKVETQAFLHAVSRSFIEASDSSEALERVMHKTLAFTKAEFGGILLRFGLEQGEDIKIFKAGTSPQQQESCDSGVLLIEQLALRMAGNAQPIIISPKEEFLDDVKIGGETSFKSIIGVPLESKDKIVGFLVLWNIESDYSFTQDDLHVLKIFTDELEIAIENTLFSRDLEKANKHLKLVQNKLVQSEKLASRGQIATDIAHKIDDPLNSMSDNLEALKKHVEDVAVLIEGHQELKETCEDEGAEGTKKLKEEISKLREPVDTDSILRNIEKLIRESKESTEKVKMIMLDLRNLTELEGESSN
ncbi:GAF domain-containing protein [Candidatus Oleimmundimicrobium sp.]|uniref:GAF domain-containing protein n=1 Tax=Candidatus Oleimmundimicrobium sp. TaxID=3060597 RepID=UPI002721B7CE|nr:GAF domain-containing protein [Candidatus Oleimmundimicrobium sp.]MDO8886689.1 GAF domain-containing protein [Candidatus Oleimmundimicrobium sp.]